MDKILIVTHGYPPDATAGTERMAQLTVQGLRRRGFDVGLFAAWNNLDQPPTDLPTERLWLQPRPDRAALWQDFNQQTRRHFRQALHQFKPNVVYFHHTVRLSYDLPLLARRTGARVVFMAHDFWLACPRSTLLAKDGTVTAQITRRQCAECLALHDHPAAAQRPLVRLIARPRLARQLLRRRDRFEQSIYRLVDMFISPSQTVAHVLRQRGVPREKMRVIPYGLPKLASHKTASSTIRFGFVGTVAPHKGVSWLIDAFQQLDRPDVSLTIWGPLAKPTELARLDGRPSIRYAGPFRPEETARVYDQIDCLIVPSLWPENQPLVILQAWQTGTPVITGNIGGLAELVHHKKNGLLYHFRDAADFLAQINRFTDNTALRERLIAGASATIVPAEEDHLDQVIRILTA